MRPIRIQIVIPPEWRDAFNEQLKRDGYWAVTRTDSPAELADLVHCRMLSQPWSK